MIHEILGANPPNSPLNPLDWPAYIVLDNFWSPGHCGVSHSCGFWNCGQEKFLADIHCFYASLCRLTATNMRLHLVWSILKVQSCKLYNNKYMIPSTQTTNTEIFLFIAVLVFKLLTRKVLFIHRKKQQKLLKSRLLLIKIANFTDTLLQNYKQLECEILRILLKQVSDHLSVLFQFA